MKCYWYKTTGTHGLCPVCEQGRLFVKKQTNGQELYLMCEECFCVFNTPAGASEGGNCQEIDVPGNFATEEGIKNQGWSQYTFEEAVL